MGFLAPFNLLCLIVVVRLSVHTDNEMVPPTDDPAYLASSSANVYAAMSKADPDAIWLMQGWLFQNAGFVSRNPPPGGNDVHLLCAVVQFR